MTIQIPDSMYYKRRKYELVLPQTLPEILELPGVTEIFESRSLRGNHTANWRGYISTFAVKSGDLVLRSLECSGFTYKKLEIPIIYTGRIILGGGQILGTIDYLPDWTIYELVHELHFEDGNLVEARDLTAEAEQRRLTNPSNFD